MPAPVLVVARKGTRTQPEVLLAPDPAAAFRRADAAWRARGRSPIDVNSSARSYVLQTQLRNTWLEFDRNRALWRRLHPGRPDPPFALDPDLSKHVQGEAIDSDDHSKPGFIAHMAEYGFIQTALAIKEPWHLDYIRSRDEHKGEAPAGGGSIPLPIPAPEEDEDMIRVKSGKTGNWFVIGETTVTSIAAGPVGSENYARARAYSDAAGQVIEKDGEKVLIPKPFIVLSSTAIQGLLADCAARAAKAGSQLVGEIEQYLADERQAVQAAAELITES